MEATQATEQYQFDVTRIAEDFLVSFCDEAGIKLDLFEERNRLFLSARNWLMEIHSFRDDKIDPGEDYIHVAMPLIAQPRSPDQQLRLMKFLLANAGDWRAGKLLYDERCQLLGWHHAFPASQYEANGFRALLGIAIATRNGFDDMIKAQFPEALGLVVNSWQYVSQLMEGTE